MGPKQPELRLQDQQYDSFTNRNLFVPPSHIDEVGTYPLSVSLLERESFARTPGGPPIRLDKNQVIPWWSKCKYEPCPMIVKDFNTRKAKRELTESGTYQKLVLSVDIELWDTPRIDRCPAMCCLMELCQTDTERKFLHRYY